MVRGLALVSLVNPTGLFRDASAASTLAPHRLRSREGSRSRRMPRESRNVPEDLPKERRCQVALGQLEDEIPGMADEATAGLEQPLLEAREGPALDGERQDQSAQQIAEIVGDDAQDQPDLVGPEPVTGVASPIG